MQLRLDPEKQLIYEAEASARDLPLVGYLRQRLEAGDAMQGELATLLNQVFALRQLVERLAGAREVAPAAPAAAPVGGGRDSMVAEVVLLLRTLSKPANLQVVHAEMKRLGIPVWQGEEGGNDDA
ncbi:mobilization protein [Denitromonas sp.]|uniref:mobilization protein n=1 Tax=Denitromonas sp. TaxID=2734609 RepID=UPI002AFE529D|nr:mobilization protein [Denitromonas sp.]